MKNFIEIKDIEGTKALINVSQISVIEETADGIVIHMKGNRDVFRGCNLNCVKACS